MSDASGTAAAAVEVYPLSPMQRGMLSQTLASPGGGLYSVIVSYRMKGPLRAPLFIEAWRRVVDHHPVLRTSFDWVERAEAVQRVHASVSLETREEDWRALAEPEHAERLRATMEAEQVREFDLTTAPLLRLTLVRCAEDVHELVVTHHHILIDGSCKAMLFAQVFAVYDGLLRGQPAHLEPARSYRAFVDWLRQQPLDDAEIFWRGALRGFATPTPLWESAAEAAPAREYDEYRLRLDADGSERLRQLARKHRLTLNTLISGVWGVLLARAAQVDDVVFGASINTRPADLDGAETMLGLFINTVPVRVRVERQLKVVDWLKALQRSQAEAREHGHVALPTILRWSEVTGGQPLFDSIVVFENNAGYDGRVERYSAIEIVAVQPLVRTSLPLTLRCVPGSEIECHLLYDTRRFSAKTIASVGAALQDALTALPGQPDAPLADLFQTIDALERARERADAEAYRQRLHGRLQAMRGGARRTGEASR